MRRAIQGKLLFSFYYLNDPGFSFLIIFGFGWKWKEGDEIPESWLDYYRLNPCVPVDYSTIHKAITSTLIECYRRRSVRKIRVFIRPGKHYLRQSVIIRLIPGCEISVETMAVPRNTFQPFRPKEVREQPIATTMVTSKKKVKKGLRDWMGCTRPEVIEHSDTEECSENWGSKLRKLGVQISGRSSPQRYRNIPPCLNAQ